MKEKGWLTSVSPPAMLAHVRSLRGNPWTRWVRFNIACCRRVGHVLADERFWKFLTTVEGLLKDFPHRQCWHYDKRRDATSWRFHPQKPITSGYDLADIERYSVGQTSFRPNSRRRLFDPSEAATKSYREALAAFCLARYQLLNPVPEFPRCSLAAVHAMNAIAGVLAMNNFARDSARLAVSQSLPKGQRRNAKETEDEEQCKLLRCIFGNPFRPVAPDPRWLTPKVVGMAQAIDDGGRFNELPALADALEAAGCTDAEMLTHCRGPDPHARGCWVVDLLLGDAPLSNPIQPSAESGRRSRGAKGRWLTMKLHSVEEFQRWAASLGLVGGKWGLPDSFAYPPGRGLVQSWALPRNSIECLQFVNAVLAGLAPWRTCVLWPGRRWPFEVWWPHGGCDTTTWSMFLRGVGIPSDWEGAVRFGREKADIVKAVAFTFAAFGSTGQDDLLVIPDHGKQFIHIDPSNTDTGDSFGLIQPACKIHSRSVESAERLADHMARMSFGRPLPSGE